MINDKHFRKHRGTQRSSDFPKVRDGSPTGIGPQSWPGFSQAPCSKCGTGGHLQCSGLYSTGQPTCSELPASWASPYHCSPTRPHRPRPLQLRAPATLGVGLGRANDSWGKENRTVGDGHVGPWRGPVGEQKRGAAYVESIYIYSCIHTSCSSCKNMLLTDPPPAICPKISSGTDGYG